MQEALNKVTEDIKSSQTSVVETEVKSVKSTSLLVNSVDVERFRLSSCNRLWLRLRHRSKRSRIKNIDVRFSFCTGYHKVMLRRSLVWLQSTKDSANSCWFTLMWESLMNILEEFWDLDVVDDASGRGSTHILIQFGSTTLKTLLWSLYTNWNLWIANFTQ